MKSFLSLFLGLNVAPLAYAAVPELSGLITLGGETRLVLVDPSTGAPSKWLTVGDGFFGYVVKGYEPDSATAILEREGTEFRVALRKPAVLAPTPKSLAIYCLPDGQIALEDAFMSLPDLRRALQADGAIKRFDVRLVVYPHQDLDLLKQVMKIMSETSVRRVSIENIPHLVD